MAFCWNSSCTLSQACCRSGAGLNPAWREAGAHVVVASLWPDGAAAADIQERKDIIRERSQVLRALAPDSGAYVNEVCLSLVGHIFLAEHNVPGFDIRAEFPARLLRRPL